MDQTRSAIADAVVHTVLKDGTAICIRAIGPDDGALMRDGIARLSRDSRYLRFFSAQPMPPDRVIDSLVAVDGQDHIAWGAIATGEPGNPAIGAAHAVRDPSHPHRAEFSIGIVDAYHGVGLARLLVAILLTHCQIEGITRLEAQVLSHNDAARGLVNMLCGQQGATDMGVTDWVLDTGAALRCLEAEADSDSLRALLAQLARYR